jgi:hypothetical protein
MNRAMVHSYPNPGLPQQSDPRRQKRATDPLSSSGLAKRGNQMRCVLCGDTLEEGNGDNWDDLCPSCADQVSEIMDENVSVDRSEAIEQARRRQS